MNVFCNGQFYSSKTLTAVFQKQTEIGSLERNLPVNCKFFRDSIPILSDKTET